MNALTTAQFFDDVDTFAAAALKDFGRCCSTEQR